MKKIVPLYVLLIIFSIGCKENTNVKSSKQSNLQNESLRNSLIGQWGGFGKPVWDIRKDSIYYFERSTAYPHKIINHDFVIYFSDHTAALRNIRVDKDTIFFLGDMGLIVRAYKTKKSDIQQTP